MTYGHLRADCLYTGVSSGPNARYRVWEAFTFTFIHPQADESQYVPHFLMQVISEDIKSLK